MARKNVTHIHNAAVPWYGWLLIIGVVLGGFMWVTHTGPFALAGGTNGGGPGGTSYASCPTSGIISVWGFATYTNNLGQVQADIATPFAFYKGGFGAGANPSYTGTLTAGAATEVGNVTCGQTVSGTIGDNVSYYTQIIGPITNPAVGAQQFNTTVLEPMALPQIQWVNGTGVYQNNAIVFASNGQSYPVTLTLSPGSGFFGHKYVEALYYINTTELTGVTMSALSAGTSVSTLAAAVPAGLNTVSGSTATAYQIPSVNWITGKVQYTVTVKTNALNANTAVANPVQLFLINGVAFVQNGQPDNNGADVYVNPISNAKVGYAAFNAVPVTQPINSNGLAATTITAPGILVYK